MPPHKLFPPPSQVPDKSAVAQIAPEDLASSELQAVFAVWDERRRVGLAMPSRTAILPKPLSAYLRHVSLLHFLPETDDYEFRIVGDAHVQAYGVNTQGQRMSDVIAAAPEFGRILKASYESVRASKAPLGYRGLIGRDAGDARFVWFETIYLPLATRDDEVDYVLNASVYAPRDGKWPT